MVIVQSLARKLPRRYVAHPRVHLGAFAEIDVSTYEKEEPPAPLAVNGNAGDLATAVSQSVQLNRLKGSSAFFKSSTSAKRWLVSRARARWMLSANSFGMSARR